MKRELLCESCGRRAYRSRRATIIEPGEHWELKSGVSVVDAVCDMCDAQLKPGDKVTCSTICLAGQQYSGWEDEYMAASA